MSTPIRKKRNFKALQLATSPTSPSSPSAPSADSIASAATITSASTVSSALPSNSSEQPIPTRQAPAGKKRPAPITLKAPKLPPSTTGAPAPSVEDGNLLTVQSNPSNSAPNTASIGVNSKRNTYHTTLSNTLANLDLNKNKNSNGVEAPYFDNLRNEDLRDIRELGQGNGGSVKLVEHTPSGLKMAKKIVLIDAKPAVRKQILRELHILHDCHSPFIISFHGAFLSDPNICICMEFMNKSSLDGIYKKIGPIDVAVVGKVAWAVLEGLTYLYDAHRIIHRDIKPSNILCNSKGEIKICDFGVSGELINSIADTFVGTSTYMSPERIQGAQYTVKSDVWSLGISLIELALGRFPFSESPDDDSDLSDLDDFPTMDSLREDLEGLGDDYDLEGTLSPARPGSMGSIAALSLQPPSSRNKPNSTSSKANNRSSVPLLNTNSLSVSNAHSHSHSHSISSTNTHAGASNGNGNGNGHRPTGRPKKEKKETSKKDKRKSKGVSLQGGGMTMSILELLQHIVNEPAPRLTSVVSEGNVISGVRVPKEAEIFVDSCLLKDPDERKTPKELLKFPWIEQAKASDFDVEAWASTF